MPEDLLRNPETIRQDCAGKLRGVETSGSFLASLGYFLGEKWTNPVIVELCLTPDRLVIARTEGEAASKRSMGAKSDLIRHIHGIAKVAGLDGDELGYLLAGVAQIKRQE